MPDAPGGEFLPALTRSLDESVRLTTGEAPGDRHTVTVYVGGTPSADVLASLPALETVLIPYAGVPKRTRELLLERTGVALHNLHHNAAPTAELAVTLMLAAAKRVVPLDRALRAGDWRPRYAPSIAPLLEGRTAVVLGYGHIGRRVARTCLALGMHVVGVRRAEGPDPELPAVEVRAPAALPDLWPRAQVLFVCLPSTPATKGVVDAAALAAMPDDAVIVNVGRGAIIEEAAFYAALRSGGIGAAGLDVWYRYPREEGEREQTLPAEHPFHELDNVVLSPHRAGHTVETERLRGEHVAALLNQAARGDVLDNRVDVEAGY
ncbi:MAG: 2-hydroxyacid dehydrogenase [Planctomycetota bacterium]|nr:2-hydroxyacid dehydrogenase [Planctomycetota bacterium]